MAIDFVEQDGVIGFTLPATDGTDGVGWIRRLEGKGLKVEEYSAKRVLYSDAFEATKGITYGVKILKGNLFSDEQRITRLIQEQAQKLGFITPPLEVACLVYEKLLDLIDLMKRSGLEGLVFMHTPVTNRTGQFLFAISHNDEGRWNLRCGLGGNPESWYRDFEGLVFIDQV